jgi:diguanylate cyclase (GGDEF)-like protein/PAS domain S-box-containing protein
MQIPDVMCGGSPMGPAVPGESRAPDVVAEIEALVRSEAWYRALALGSTDLVLVVEAGLDITFASPSVRALLGREPASLTGGSLIGLAHPADLDGLVSWIDALLTGDDGSLGFDVRLGHTDGLWRDFELVGNDLSKDPVMGGLVINGRDVTQRRHADRMSSHHASHDFLTGLADRPLLLDQVERLVQRAPAGADSLVVVVVGLDRFKSLNDRVGHAAGDRLLIAASERLRRVTPTGHHVGRLGGATFVVAGTGAPGEVEVLARRLIDVLAEPVVLDGRHIDMTASAGIACRRRGQDGAAMLRDADLAMHKAKRRGGNRIEWFETNLGRRPLREFDLEKRIGEAVTGNELRVHFQPIMALGTTGPVGVEALVRWQHPEMGLIAPGEFLPLAERTGDIVDIGDWVLRESCRTIMNWAGNAEPLHLSVNLSARQLAHPDLDSTVASILRETGMAATGLTMEIADTSLIDDDPTATHALDRLHGMGVSLAVDDFGTGYSSLPSLQHVAIDTLKIDSSFVEGLGREGEDDAIVFAIINLARSLGLGIIAEGVETEAQRQALLALGCERAQGYLFSAPLTSEAFLTWHKPTTRRSVS